MKILLLVTAALTVASAAFAADKPRVFVLTDIGNEPDDAQSMVRFLMPPSTGTLHIILAVTDNGTPRLTLYQRVIVTVVP